MPDIHLIRSKLETIISLDTKEGLKVGSCPNDDSK